MDAQKADERLQHKQNLRARLTEFYRHLPTTVEDSNKVYNEWADTYDKEKVSANYAAPRQLAEYFHKYAPQLGLSKDCEILDVAAGTGWVGQELKKLGYKNIDGVDPNEPMFQQAREKQVYRNYMSFYVGDSPMPIQDGSYGATVICGSIFHTTAAGLEDMIRVIKPGGLFLSVGQLQWMSTCTKWMMPTLYQLQEKGVVKKLEIDIPPDYYHMEKLSVVLVYQKL